MQKTSEYCLHDVNLTINEYNLSVNIVLKRRFILKHLVKISLLKKDKKKNHFF